MESKLQEAATRVRETATALDEARQQRVRLASELDRAQHAEHQAFEEFRAAKNALANVALNNHRLEGEQ